MPELPEVETVARQLAPLIESRRILRLEIFDPKLALDAPEAAHGRVICSVRRLGKQVLMDLQDPCGCKPPLWLAVHLRMTGRLIWSTEARQPAPAPPLRARLRLTGGWVLFKDVRRFGTLRLLASTELLEPGGIDPFCGDFSPRTLAERLAGARQPIKPWLLRQDRLAGLGNIYACEALYHARLSPHRPAGSLSPDETARLHRAILKVLSMGIECGGTTFATFENAHGENGTFQRKLAVYGRAGQPCRRCRAPIERTTQQGRGTFYCPNCQSESALPRQSESA